MPPPEDCVSSLAAQSTENAEPLPSSVEGVAAAVAALPVSVPLMPEPRSPPPKPFEALGESCIAVADQAESEIGPVWPSAVAGASLNAIFPKSASGSVWQLSSEPWQAEGASAIHSADEVSGLSISSVLLKLLPVVLLVISIETWLPSTPTVVETVSPGLTSRSVVTGASGTSSYQVVYSGEPLLQSTSVPACSSAWAPVTPPMPTQKAATPAPLSQFASGCTHVPETLENCAPVVA